MRVYDVSVPLQARMPVWDGAAGPSLEIVASIAAGDHSTASRFSMDSHTGTRIDAPAHFIRDAVTVEAIAPDVLVGPALVIEHLEPGHVTAVGLSSLGVRDGQERVLIKTPNQRLWSDPEFRRDYVALSPDGAEFLIERGVRLVGIDYLSIEACETAVWGVHRSLLGAGVVVLEGLDLRLVSPGEYLLACAPLKLVGAEGARARVYLIES